MLLRDIHQRLQAAVAQPAFHPLKPLWGVIHLRRHRADHHNGFCPAPRRLLYRHRVADTAVKIAYPLQQGAGAVESGIALDARMISSQFSFCGEK